MTWIMILAFYFNTSITFVQEFKFRTQFSCEEAAKLIHQEFQDVKIKHLCLKTWERKHKKNLQPIITK